MFDSFEQLNASYVPRNIESCGCEKRNQYNALKDNIINNVFGEQSGFKYFYGQEITMDFDIDNIIYVEDNAIVSCVSQQEPTQSTAGEYGQYYYNLADLKLFKCVNFGQTYYDWEEQEFFTYPEKGTQKVIIEANSSPITLKVYNTRGEVVFTKDLAYNAKTLTITSEECQGIIPDLYKFVFFTNEKAKLSYDVVIVDTRDAFNKDINEIQRTDD